MYSSELAVLPAVDLTTDLLRSYNYWYLFKVRPRKTSCTATCSLCSEKLPLGQGTCC